jgi:hypothetical protein
MRILVCTLAVMLPSALGRAQQPAPPPPPQIIAPITKPTTTEPTPPAAGTVTVDGKKTMTISADWLKQQSDDLLSVVACYLDKDSVDNLTNAETEKQLDVMKSIEVRIKLLGKLAKENTSSHCQ